MQVWAEPPSLPLRSQVQLLAKPPFGQLGTFLRNLLSEGGLLCFSPSSPPPPLPTSPLLFNYNLVLISLGKSSTLGPHTHGRIAAIETGIKMRRAAVWRYSSSALVFQTILPLMRHSLKHAEARLFPRLRVRAMQPRPTRTPF